MPFRLGAWEVGLIVLIILIVFGLGKLPQVGGALGKGLHAFRSAQRGEDKETEEKPDSKSNNIQPKAMPTDER